MSVKYIVGSVCLLPLLPLMVIHGKYVRSKVPILPEAEGPEGYLHGGSGKKLKIIYLGESTVAGVGVSTHDDGFAGRLSELLSIHSDASVEWKVYAKSGYTAKNLKDIIIPSIDEQTADLIVIGLGGNDAFTLNTPWAWKKTIRELILDLRSKFENVPIVFMNMPPIKEFPAFTWLMKNSIGNLVEIFGTELADAVKEFDHVYFHSRRISFHDWENRFQITDDGAQFFSDGVHPSKLTYQTWAKDISMFIIENKVLH